MNKTKILAALAIPALLAACSQDEFTENAIDKNVDLSNRKVLENVVLNFGDADALTRGTIGTSSFNSYKWTSEDGVGACIIDAPNNKGGYDITNYISSNYKYYWTADNQWKTDALMVEGNYMFYAPYNEEHMVRSSIVAEVPTTQNVLTKTDDNNAIKEFYESGKPVFVGYKFLTAKDQPKVIDVAMKHIFAYPLFKLTNLYDTREDKTKGTPVYQDIKITKIELKCGGNGKFGKAFKAKNENIAGRLKADAAKPWDAGKHEDNVTAGTDGLFEALTDSEGKAIVADKITINLGEGITLKGEESLSFHAVLPAAAYADGISVIAYDDKGNTYSPKAKAATTGLTLNPGYRYPAQEYNTDGTLKKSKGQLLTFKLEDKNAAPTDIINNDDFIDYLKSLSVRYNDLEEVASSTSNKKENQFVLNENAQITINSALIDALDNYNHVDETIGGKVTFTTETIALASDVIVTAATEENNNVVLETKSAAGKTYTFVLKTQTITDGTIEKNAQGTFVINAESSDVEITVAEDVKAPVNIIVMGAGTTDGVTFGGANANKITSLNVVGDGSKLTLTDNVSGVVINNGEKLVVKNGKHIDSKIVNNGEVENNGIMFNTANVNNGTVTVEATAAVTKIGAGTGVVVNNEAKPVIVGENATQAVTWTGGMANVLSSDGKSGLSVTGSANLGINQITITDETVNTTLALLKAPVKGCTVSTITFSKATALNMKDGGDMKGLTLVFDEGCTWTGDIVNKPEFTNATIRVADNKSLTINYASVSGKLDKSVEGYKNTTTSTIVKGTGADINF